MLATLVVINTAPDENVVFNSPQFIHSLCSMRHPNNDKPFFTMFDKKVFKYFYDSCQENV